MENDEFIEEQLKANNIECHGKDVFPSYGEMTPDVIRKSVFGKMNDTIEYNKDLVVGIWSGYDDNRKSETSDGKQIKYMWADIIENYLKDKDTDWYTLPNNVVGVLVDPISGNVADTNTKNPTMFYYIKGTEPTYIDGSLESLIPTIKQE